jgi:hypothetical protein
MPRGGGGKMERGDLSRAARAFDRVFGMRIIL